MSYHFSHLEGTDIGASDVFNITFSGREVARRSNRDDFQSYANIFLSRAKRGTLVDEKFGPVQLEIEAEPISHWPRVTLILKDAAGHTLLWNKITDGSFYQTAARFRGAGRFETLNDMDENPKFDIQGMGHTVWGSSLIGASKLRQQMKPYVAQRPPLAAEGQGPAVTLFRAISHYIA